MLIKSYILFILIVFLTGKTFSQSWELQTGGIDITSKSTLSISYINSTVWAARNADFFKSTNNGDTWKIQTNLFNDNASSVFFINELTGWITFTYSKKILKTIDGGNSWVIKDTSHSTNSIYFTDETNGYAVGDEGLIIKTTNGGDNWEIKNSGITERLNSVKFVNAYTGWACGEWGSLIKTTDSGNNWYVQKTGLVTYFKSMFFMNKDSGFICGTGGKIIKTTNGGNQWLVCQTGSQENIQSVFFFNYQSGVATGSNGLTLRTSNSGTSWLSNKTDSVHNEFLSAFSPSGTGFGIFTGGILKTVNYGDSWNISYYKFLTNLHFVSVNFINDNTGWTCGEKYSLYKTTNSGYNWIKLNLGLPESYGKYLRSVKFVNENIGWVCGDSGVIFKTLDGGKFWTRQNSRTVINLKSIAILNETQGLICGPGPWILRTSNGGNTWDSVFVGYNTALYAVQYINSNDVWVSGSIGKLYRSSDGGLNWVRITNPLNSLFSIFFIDSNTGFVSSESRVMKTTNAGNTWQLQEIISYDNILSLYFESADKGWCTSGGSTFSSGRIYYTSNGGTNWVKQYDIKPGLNSICFTSSGIGWAVGNFGTVLHTTNSGVIIHNISSPVPNNFNLYQNYPNPFNPATTIKFDIPRSGLVKINIHDILGRKVTTLKNEILNPGSYSIDWNAASLPSGIYFAKLTSGSFSITRRLVLIK